MKSHRLLENFFILIMFLFVLFLAVWTPLNARQSARLQEARMSLETSQGRERKQQHEYDQVLEELPKARQELAEIQPRTDEALQLVADLKAQRKDLRATKKELEAQLEQMEKEGGQQP